MLCLKILILDKDAFIEKTISSFFKDSFIVNRISLFDNDESYDFDIFIIVGDESNFSSINKIFDLLKSKYRKTKVIIVFNSTNVNNFNFFFNKSYGFLIDKNEKDFGSKLIKLIDKIALKLKNKITYTNNNLIYKSSKINCIVNDISRLKQDDNFIIYGETGVGKTPVAMYAYNLRKSKVAFQKTNCAGLSKDHFYSLLFGHVKGSYTGAHSDRVGLIERANNSDLFLDEISSLDIDAQGLLLNYLDTGEYRRLGEDKLRFSNARIICASNKDLNKMAKEGFFRKDLLTRFTDYIEVPPLRERKEDIEPLFNYFADVYDDDNLIDRSIVSYLYDCEWRDANVRELKFFVKKLSIGKPFNLKNFIEKNEVIIIDQNYENLVLKFGIKKVMYKIEKDILINLFQKHNSLTKLAKAVKISSPGMIRKIKKFKLR